VVVVTVMAAEGEARKLAFRQGGGAIGSSGDAEMDRALAEEARAALEARAPRYAEEPVAAHFEPVLPYPTLLIFGAGHVAQPLAQMAALAGFRVIVVDDREEFANRERFPTADEVVVAEVAEAFGRAHVDEESYVVAVTRGHVMDEEVVAQALGTPARYIGMIGSRRKVAAVRERLRGRGFGEADLDRIHAPIGLDIGADTVEEIAVSIVAELVQERRRGA
jgi:xanthine dehydrogenase accessory factor